MKSFIILIFSLLTFQAVQAQIEQTTLIQADEEAYITFHFENNFNAETAADLLDVLENFNIDKITYVECDYQLEKFYLKTTPLFNKIEILDIFRDHGMESYLIENNKMIRLNGTATGTYEVNNSEN